MIYYNLIKVVLIKNYIVSVAEFIVNITPP